MEPRRHVLGPVTVSRIGFGAMQLPGPGLIRAALHPYPAGLALVSKVGARRDASGGVLRYDRGIGLSNVTPGHLRRALAGTDIACVQNLLNRNDRRAPASPAAPARSRPARRLPPPPPACTSPPPRWRWPGCWT